ncbi:hypothetical protein RB595_004002 [Gaeumannomyces hyphopodioides]
MAPRTNGANRRTLASEQVFELGKQGRKTGVVLPDSGVRDENGIMPLKGIFDSPGKDRASDDDDDDDDDDDENSDEADMDIENTPGPDPRSLLKKQQSARRPIPRARSPALTNLQSPPMRVGESSPLRRPAPGGAASQLKSGATRRLNFDATEHGLPKPAGASRMPNGGAPSDEDDDEGATNHDDIDAVVEESLAILDMGDDDDDMPDPVDDAETEPEPESEPEPERVVSKTTAGRAKAAAAKQVAAAPVPSKRGRKKRSSPEPPAEPEPEEAEEEEDEEEEEEEEEPVPAKRGRPAAKGKAKEVAPPKQQQADSGKRRRGAPGRHSANSATSDQPDPEPEPEPEPAAKRQRVAPTAAAPATKGRGRKPAAATKPSVAEPDAEEEGESSAAPASQPKQRGRKPKKAAAAGGGDVGDTSVVIVPRAPLPKRSGLVINRRDVPGESDAITRTRSGRSSFRPLSWWRNEHVEMEKDEVEDTLPGRKGSRIVLPSVKEVVRVEQESPQHARRGRGRPSSKAAGKRGRRRAGADDSDGEDPDEEPWEEEGGQVVGNVVVWEPEHEFDPPGVDDQVAVEEDVMAYSNRAIQTREILGSTFRFTKTLSLPFFGTGVVDLPPGSEKKAKNSRKMHMTFIVHSGRVTVMVNETTFSLGKGGMWFVPRGNYYSIANEGNKLARIFFAQACEITREPPQEESEAATGE